MGGDVIECFHIFICPKENSHRNKGVSAVLGSNQAEL